ncbi:hypothetical protein DL93DRAFT_2173774 [Clavulina sp. PMI_390]|nr:hypothetical protein DL93DRAFT_2173774 [Clavulina sp. PMI_390]
MLPTAYASSLLPLQATAAVLERAVPGISTADAFLLLHAIYYNRSAIRLNTIQSQASSRAWQVRAWLNRIATWMFESHPPVQQLHDVQGMPVNEPTLGKLLGHLADSLGLDDESPPPTVLPTTETVLVPLYEDCQQCAGTLQQDLRPLKPVWVAPFVASTTLMQHI